MITDESYLEAMRNATRRKGAIQKVSLTAFSETQSIKNKEVLLECLNSTPLHKVNHRENKTLIIKWATRLENSIIASNNSVLANASKIKRTSRIIRTNIYTTRRKNTSTCSKHEFNYHNEHLLLKHTFATLETAAFPPSPILPYFSGFTFTDWIY